MMLTSHFPPFSLTKGFCLPSSSIRRRGTDFDLTDGACRALVSVYHSDRHVPTKSSASFRNSGKPKTKIDSSQRSYERINAFQPRDSSFFEDLSISENDRGKQTSTCAGIPFSLILPRSISSTYGSKWLGKKKKLECSYQVLKSGMILLKNYLSLNEQVLRMRLRPSNGTEQMHLLCTGFLIL